MTTNGKGDDSGWTSMRHHLQILVDRMFRRQQNEVKKSAQKVLDIKKDSASRVKHLRVLLDSFEIGEAKSFFETNFSQIYYIFFDTLSSIEGLLKQRPQKQTREELDSLLFIFEKILTLLPELLSRRWQFNSIIILMKKLLHHLNTTKIRQEGLRLFLIWYQILGFDATSIEVEDIFATLIPGVVPGHTNHFLVNHPVEPSSSPSPESSSFYTVTPRLLTEQTSLTSSAGLPSPSDPNPPSPMASVYNVYPLDIEPMLPAFGPEPPINNVTCFYLQWLLEYIVTQGIRIVWRDKREFKQLKCFEFLFEKLRNVYLPHIFPHFNASFSYYNLVFELPELRVYNEADWDADPKRFSHRDTLLHCRAIVIRWLAKYVRFEEMETVSRKDSSDDYPPHFNRSMSSQISVVDVTSHQSTNDFREPTSFEYSVIRSTLYSSRANVNLIHELFRQAFLLPFSDMNGPITMRKVIAVYKDWIFKTSTEVPLFMMEPLSQHSSNGMEDIRGGMSNLLRVFSTNAANVFLLRLPADKIFVLEEQVDMCKRILNVYRYMVMNVDMDKHAWEQLLRVLLRITSLVIPEKVPAKKEETLGGRLAPAFFQTLIVTWIRANLNVTVTQNLWDQFRLTMSSLALWEELIREWSKTMDTVTRVMSRFVYNINLHDLPLNRPSERKQKKYKAARGIPQRRLVDGANKQSVLPRQEDHIDEGRSSYNAPSLVSQTHTLNIHRSYSDSKLLEMHWKENFKVISKCKSLDGINKRTDSCCESPTSRSRSPSPTPSNSVENNSLNDSPLNLDATSLNCPNTNSADSVRCVLVGGSYKGWAQDSAVVLWRRMLGILGDVNTISDPDIYAQVIECLAKIVDDFIKIRKNIGISFDNKSTPPPPQIVPPLLHIASWLFQAVRRDDTFKRGKLIAYRTLCAMVVKKEDIHLSLDFLSLFYEVIHEAFVSHDLEIISIIILLCQCKLFTLGLPGATCLVYDFISGTSDVIATSESKGVPRAEALGILGSLLSMSSILKDMQGLDPLSSEPSVIHRKEFKEPILSMLLKASKREHTGLGRCVALNCLGVFMYNEISANQRNKSVNSRLSEIASVLVAGTRFNNRVLSRIACDAIRLQCDHVTYLLDNHQDIPKLIIEGLAGSLMNHTILAAKANLFKDYRSLLMTLILCLGEWCLCVPNVFLKTTVSGDGRLLSEVLRVLSYVESNHESSVINDNYIRNSHLPDYGVDFSIYDGEGTSQELTPTNSPKRRQNGIAGDVVHRSNAPLFAVGDIQDQDRQVIRLAAKMLIGHLVNHLGHFPNPHLGAAVINSFVNELDDNLRVIKAPNETDELTPDLLNINNTVLLLVNDSRVVSFTELNNEDVEEGMPLKTMSRSKNGVRVVVRDMTGKFAWDCNQLHTNQVNSRLSQGTHLDTRTCDGYMNNNNVSDMVRESYDDDDDDEKANIYQRCTDDALDKLLNHLSKSSPECVTNKRRQHTNSGSVMMCEWGPRVLQAEENMTALHVHQFYQEKEFLRKANYDPVKLAGSRKNSSESSLASMSLCAGSYPPSSLVEQVANFQNCRQLIDQLGHLFWDKRDKVELLPRSEQLLRELRNLDNQRCREIHKIAVIFVDHGQEDRNSILLNKSGSKEFEQFVSSLGWEIDLEKHRGFRGGLKPNKSTGQTAPYYATPLMEVIFHVSTRIEPAAGEEEDTARVKWQHMGNDEVHIVWSEHYREYRSDIIPTEFGDILIVIYPVRYYPGYYRIQIATKPDRKIPSFGPLYNGTVVHLSVLPGLVRATAINASRAQRININDYQLFFQERNRLIEQHVASRKEKLCFEDFATRLYSPTSLGLITSRPVSSLSGPLANESNSSGSTLLSPETYNSSSPQLRTRPVSMSSASPRAGYPHQQQQPAIYQQRDRPHSSLSANSAVH